MCGAELLREWSSAAPRNTDDRPVIEFSAAASHYGSVSRRVLEGMEAVLWLRAEEERRLAAASRAQPDL